MKLWKIIVGLLVLFFMIFVWVFVIGVSSNKHGSYYNQGNNAIWLEHRWVGDDVSEAEISEMVLKLKRNDFNIVYVHSGPFKSDGSIDFETYKYAQSFLEKARKYNSDMHYQTWLGQIRSLIDLSDPSVRKNIVNQAVILTKIIGFDGVHFDIEPVWDGDMDFITLLKETREALGDDVVISVALAEFIPRIVLNTAGRFYEFVNYNSDVIYSNVADYVDQIIVMVYDTSIKSEWLYRFLVKEQLIWVTRLYQDKEVFIAIPSYDYTTDAFDPSVENVENGLLGLTAGLNDFRARNRNFSGVAIYPYWFMDEDDWKIYKQLWMKK